MKKILSLIFAIIIETCSIFMSMVSFANTFIDDKAVTIKNNESKTQTLKYGETTEKKDNLNNSGFTIYNETSYETAIYYKFTPTKEAIYDFVLTGWDYNEDDSVSAKMNFCTKDGKWDEKSVWLKGKYDAKYKAVAIVACIKAGQTYYIKASYDPSKTLTYKNNGNKATTNLTLSVLEHRHRYSKVNDSSDPDAVYNCDWCGQVILRGNPNIPKIEKMLKNPNSIMTADIKILNSSYN